MRPLSVATLACACILIGCQDDAPFDQIGYLKDDATRDRVYVLQATAPVTAEAAREEAEAQQFTEGQRTAVFIFDHGTDGTAQGSGKADYATAFSYMTDSATVPPWRWLLERFPSGEMRWSDCREAAGAGICK